MVVHHPYRRQGGFIVLRGGCFAILITLALLIGGGQMLYTGLKNREPLTLSAKDYLAKKPNVEWVHITGAECDLSSCATSGMLGNVEELYIPVRVPGDARSKPVEVLLKTKNLALVNVMDALKKAGNDPEAMRKAVAGKGELLAGPREVTGLVQFGIESDSRKREKLAKLNLNLAPDFVIIEDGAKPALGTGALLLAGGLLMGFFLMRRSATSAPAR